MRLHCGVLGTIIVALCFECRLSLLLRVAELEAKLLPGFARCARLFAKLMGATGLGRVAKSRSLKPVMPCMYGSKNGQASGKTFDVGGFYYSTQAGHVG